MKITFNEYILEYYKGRSKSIGFRYSDPTIEYTIVFLVFSDNKDFNIIKEISEKYIDIDYFNIKINNNLIQDLKYGGEITIKTKMYNEYETQSFMIELLTELPTIGYYIPTNSIYINDKDLKAIFNLKAKKQIGY
jgi:hypothetical protein